MAMEMVQFCSQIMRHVAFVAAHFLWLVFFIELFRKSDDVQHIDLSLSLVLSPRFNQLNIHERKLDLVFYTIQSVNSGYYYHCNPICVSV